MSLIGATSRSSLVPTTLSSKCASIEKLSKTSGKVPSSPATEPDKESDLVKDGSNLVAIPTSPPGPISLTCLPLASRPIISEVK